MPQIASQPISIVMNVIGHVLLQIAHPPHVLLVVHPVDDRTGAEEKQRLEERVRHHVKDRRDKRTDAAREKHVSKLRNGRVSEDLLNVVLR